MRRAGRTDSNHAAVVDALLKIGASVDSMASLGGGMPDLLVGFRGRALVLEVKDGSKSPSRRQLTADERRWFERFRGEAYVVTSAEEALDVVLRPAARASFVAGTSVEGVAEEIGVSTQMIERQLRTQQGGSK